MPIKEVATKQVVHYALELQDIGTGATTGVVIDSADYDNGVYFAALVTEWTAGTCAMTIYEDDAVGMGTAEIVAAKNLIYTSPTLGTAATVEGASIAKLGVHSTKRYLRVTLTGDGTSNMDVVVLAIKNPEVMATAQGGL